MPETPVLETYDIVIIGAGPAGSSAAQAAARRGVKVLLIDRKQRLGVPVQCAELVPQWISRHADFSPKCIIQSVEGMIAHLPDGSSYEMKGPGYMLDRSLFDKELAARAISSGARILTETKAVALSSGGLVIERGLEQETLQSKVIIGADGVHSSVARFIGLAPIKTIVALQYEVALTESQNHVDIFFHRDYEGGYAWFFPKGKTANVGLGTIPQKAPLLSDLMNQFLNHLADMKKFKNRSIIGKTGGSVPCGLPQQTVLGNTLLVGDAAGHAHPVTGAGILHAVMGGEIAGRVAAEAIAKGDPRYLENYESEWREAFGKTLSYGALKRGYLEENWNKPEGDFAALIRKTWVGFKEYYEDRKRG
ncbi:MAG: geranylgeranyl reductase family protein [Thermodesulfobacteriota bacterium]